MLVKNKIYLSSGGNFDKTKTIDLHFIKSIRESKKLTILFIPTAKDTDQEGFKKCFEWLRNKLDLLNARDIIIVMETELSKYIDLEKFGAVYIGGGNTYKLKKEITESSFNERLIKYIQSGGIVYGASAGAVIMGKNIAIYQEENKNSYIMENGMSLCKDYSIRCHYVKNQDDEKIWKFIKKYNLPVIALPLGDAILVSDNKQMLIGEINAFIFNLNRTVMEIEIGHKF